MLEFSTISAQEPDAASPIEIREPEGTDQVEFAKDVLPILRRNCLACHNSTTAENDLVLETPQTILKGGAEGAAAVAGNGAESLMVVLAARQRESFMPPDGNTADAKQLTPEELGMIKRWIDQGAKGEEVAATGASIQWQPLPPGVNPILSSAITKDGDYAAASRANQIFLYHLPSKRELGRLTDPAMVESGGSAHAGVAHLDLVQSLAFSPDGQWLASGGFRVAKLWRKTGLTPLQHLGIGAWETVDVVVAPSGKLAAIGDSLGKVHLLDVSDSGQLTIRRQWRVHHGGLRALAFTSDQQQLIVATADNQVQWWNLDGESPLGVLSAPATVHDLTTAGPYLAAACGDKIVRLWPQTAPSADAPPAAIELTGHEDEAIALQTMNDETLLSASKNGEVRRWSLVEHQQTAQLNHGGPLIAFAADADVDRLATAGADKVVRLWQLSDGGKVAELQGDFRQKQLEDSAVRSEALAKRRVDLSEADIAAAQERQKSEEENQKKADEATTKANEELAAKSEALKQPLADKEAGDKLVAEGEANIAATQKEQTTAEEAIVASQEQLNQVQQAREAAANELATAEEAAKLAQARLEAAQVAFKTSEEEVNAQTKVNTDATQAKADIDKKLVELQQKLATDQEQAGKLAEAAKKAADELEASQRTQEATQRASERAKQAVERVAATIPVFEQAKAVEVQQHQQTTQHLEQARQAFAASAHEVTTLCFLDGGRTLAAGHDGKLITWDAATGADLEVRGGQADSIQRLAPLGGPLAITVDANGLSVRTSEVSWQLTRVLGNIEDPNLLVDRVTALAFHPHDSLLAVGSGEPSRSGQITVWDIESGALTREIPEPHSDTVFNMSFSRDGQRLASCGADRFVKVFQISDGSLVRSFEGHTHHVLDVDFNADGRQLASSGADKVVKIWDAQTGDQKRTIAGFAKEVTSLSFIGDSQHVLVGVGDRNVHVKNADDGQNVRSLGGPTDYVYTVASSSNGKIFIAGGQDSVLRVWNDEGQPQAEFPPPSQ